MVDYIQAWQCIGCGRIEAPQTCIGVCRDKKIFVVGKETHESALEDAARLRALLTATVSRLARFVLSVPREQQYERAYVALQEEVKRLIAELSIETQAPLA